MDGDRSSTIVERSEKRQPLHMVEMVVGDEHRVSTAAAVRERRLALAEGHDTGATVEDQVVPFSQRGGEAGGVAAVAQIPGDRGGMRPPHAPEPQSVRRTLQL